MMKTGATKVGLPKPGLQERTRQGSLTHTSSSTISSAMKTSRSSNTLASDQRLSRVSQSHALQHNEKFAECGISPHCCLVARALTAGVGCFFGFFLAETSQQRRCVDEACAGLCCLRLPHEEDSDHWSHLRPC